MKKYLTAIIAIILVLLLVFGGYYIYSSNDPQNSVEDLKRKVDSEIGYLDKTIISMMNKMNNISYENYKVVEKQTPTENQNDTNTTSSGQSTSEDNTIINMDMNYSSILVNPNKKINWDSIKKETEKMYQTWNTILIDLNSLNINQDNLLKYTSVLNNLTKAVQKEDKKTTLYRLLDLYNLLVSYTKEYSNSNEQITSLDIKSNVLYAYVVIEDDKWEEVQNSIKKAQNTYNNVLNTSMQQNQNMSNMNKLYVSLNEIYRSADVKDKDIFYIHYRNLMQQIEIMEG